MDSKNMYLEKNICSIESTGVSLNPEEVGNTIPAGSVATEQNNMVCMLAKAYFPAQVYKAGFTPEVSLCNGTMFPELVRVFK